MLFRLSFWNCQPCIVLALTSPQKSLQKVQANNVFSLLTQALLLKIHSKESVGSTSKSNCTAGGQYGMEKGRQRLWEDIFEKALQSEAL